jgi:hypothetical protein
MSVAEWVRRDGFSESIEDRIDTLAALGQLRRHQRVAELHRHGSKDRTRGQAGEMLRNEVDDAMTDTSDLVGGPGKVSA